MPFPLLTTKFSFNVCGSISVLYVSSEDHLTLVRMSSIKKSTNNKCWRECGEKRALLYSWWKCKLVQTLWWIVWRFLKKLKVELMYDPEIPLLGIYMEKSIIWKDTGTPICIASLFTIAMTWKQPKCSLTDDRIEKMCIYTIECLYNGIFIW